MSNREKTDLKGFEKDLHSKAIINTDREAYLSYVENRKRAVASQNEMRKMQNEIDELKSMINKLVEQNNG